jgi:hypothetical protein
LVQTVPDGESTSPIKLTLNTGRQFVGWSDGNNSFPVRVDDNVTAAFTVTAITEPADTGWRLFAATIVNTHATAHTHANEGVKSGGCPTGYTAVGQAQCSGGNVVELIGILSSTFTFNANVSGYSVEGHGSVLYHRTGNGYISTDGIVTMGWACPDYLAVTSCESQIVPMVCGGYMSERMEGWCTIEYHPATDLRQFLDTDLPETVVVTRLSDGRKRMFVLSLDSSWYNPAPDTMFARYVAIP